MATIEQVTALLGVIAAAHPDRFEITDERIDVYADLLADLDIAALKAALRQHLAASPHPPTVADLRRLCADLSAPALPDWGEAWAELIRQIRAVGYTGSPSWSHPLIAEAVRQFGPWRELCQMEIDQTPTNRAQFRDVFNAAKARATRGDAYLPDVRAFAQATGALPAPVAAVPALPAPEPASRALSEPPAPASLADFRRYRAEQVAERETQGRAAYEAWLASQPSVVERRNAPQREAANV